MFVTWAYPRYKECDGVHFVLFLHKVLCTSFVN